MKYLSVCSGIEAATCAWHHMGWKPEAFSEIEPFPSAVLAHHYPNTPNLGDMTKYKEWNLGAIDLLVGGTPCQSFSVAGLRKGLDDPRGNLMLTFGSIARHFSPRWLVWENVPGVLSSNGGRDFGSFLGMLGELGYGFAYRVLDAQYFGVAQRRRCVFVVGYLGDWRPAAAVLFELESLSGNLKPSREKGEETSRCLTRGSAQRYDAESETMIPVGVPDVMSTLLSSTAGVSRTGNAVTEHETYIPMVGCLGGQHPNAATDTEKSPTLTNAMGSGGGHVPLVNQALMQPIPLNSMTMQGRPSDEGRMGSGIGQPGDPCPTITKAHSHAVAQPICLMDQGGSVMHIEHNMTGTLRRETHGHEPLVMQPISIQGNLIGREAGGPQGVGASDEGVMYTLTKADVHGVAQPMAVHENQRSELTLSETVGTVTCSGGKPGQGYPAVMQPTIVHGTQDPCVSDIAFAQGRNSGGENVMVQSMAVRRLTPRECERLQGFRDDYTLIPWRGKEAPDGPRYKALGNSMAVPVMRWIGERIESLRLLQG